MKKIITLLGLIAAISMVHAAEKPLDPAQTVRTLAPALLRVEYQLQYDKADAPEGGLGNERCPYCGQYHSDQLRLYLEEERPVETAGFLVGPDRVVSVDPLIHPRFIKAVTVKFRDQVVSAKIDGYALDRKAVILSLASPIKDAKPLQFGNKSDGEVNVVTYAREGGKWVTQVYPLPKQTIVPDAGEPYFLTTMKGVAVGSDGTPVGLVFNNRLTLDNSWQGSPLEWPLVSVSDLAAQMEQLQKSSRTGLVRVGLSFRSPKENSDPMSRSYRSMSSYGDENDTGTERNVIGLLLPDNELLVLANLKSRVTARLERVTVFNEDGTTVTAKFKASLKNFGAFVATLEKPLPGALKITNADLLSLRERLLLRADVSIQGETRADYFHSDRIATCEVGARQQLYPLLDEPQPENAFLFTTSMELVALPATRREQISGERDAYYSYSSHDVEITPAIYLTEAVAGLPGTADASNVPVSAEDENRLAWMGVELQPLNRDLARANGVADQTRDGETGALVTYVHPDSPAAKAGIQPGCILLRLKVPGQALPVEVRLEEDYSSLQAFPWDRLDEVSEVYFERIPTPWPSVENTFIRALTDLGFGTHYTAEFFVDGKLTSKQFEVVAGPPHYDAAPRYKSESLGLTVCDLTYDVRRYLQRKPDEPGVVISKIETGSKASIAGVKPYELITDINDQPVNNVKDFERIVSAGGEFKLSIKRMAKGRIVTLTSGQ